MITARTTGVLTKIVVTTGGSGYTSPPTVVINGAPSGGGAPAAIAIMSGTRVDEVHVSNPGYGATQQATITFTGGGGSGAAATAYTYIGNLKPISLFKGRYNDVYGVDGMARGFRWDGAATTATPIGLVRPATGPTMATSAATTKSVGTIQLIRGGAGYYEPPSVTFVGTAAVTAKAKARVVNGRVVGLTLTEPGSGYTSTPTVQLSGGIGTGATLNVGVLGRLREAVVTAQGSGYTDTPYCTGEPSLGFTVSGNYLQAPENGLSANSQFYLTARTGGTELATATTYYAVSVSGTQFAAATTSATTAVITLSSITGGRLVNPAKHLYIRCDNHGLSNGSEVQFTAISGGAGLARDVRYYAVSTNATQLKVSDASNGSPKEFTSAITAGRILVPPPVVTINNTQGLTDAKIALSVFDGRVFDAVIISAGTSATSSGQTATITGGGGTGASLSLRLLYTVNSVTATSGGTGFFVPPVVTVIPDKNDAFGVGAAVTCSVSNGVIQDPLTVVASGEYDLPPTATILDSSAQAMATLRPALDGEYKCCYRFIDDTPPSQGGPRASSISELKTVEGPAGTLTWTVDGSKADARGKKIELWRTTADQSVVLFRVATLTNTFGSSITYDDTLSDVQLRDTEREGYGLMPVTLPSGQVNARRFSIPPAEFSVACMFQDRAWYAADVTGEGLNVLYYSEVDEPESVPAANEIILQENISDADKIVGLVPFGTQLLVAQQSHLYAITYVAQPIIDAAIRLVAYRGVLNNACWAVMGGVAYFVDSHGMYAFDGGTEAPVSVAVDNYWRDGLIDFGQSDKFHVQADYDSKIVRFFYCQPGETEPTRALCYCSATKAWWEETYPVARTASCEATIGSRMDTAFGLSNGGIVKETGLSDSGTAIPYRYRSGAFSLANEKSSRTVTVLFNPTTNDANLGVRLYYNNSDTPRPNAIASDRGGAFTTVQGSTEAVINQKLSRSALGDANGIATAYYSGRVDDRSAGGDRHVSIELAGSQAGTTATDDVIVRGIVVEGAG